MDMTNETLITVSWELYQQGMPKSRIAQRLGKHRETIHLWVTGIKGFGLLGFLDKYQQAKKGERKKRQVDPIIKRRVWEIREREYDCCGQKVQYFLQKEHGVHVSVPKIYEILAEKYVIRSKWKKNKQRGPIPQAVKPRQVIQMDTIDFGELFAFTAIDIFTKEADILLAPALTAEYGYQFLLQSMRRRFDGHVNLLQTDGGPEFKAEFKSKVHSFCSHHRIARPYRKNEQSFIESFNRTVRKECLGWQKYRLQDLPECQKMVELFLKRYHYHRPHMGLGMKTPLRKEDECRISTENIAWG
jgi:transposase